MKLYSLLLLSILLAACSHSSARRSLAEANDPYLYMEEVEGAEALRFAKAENEKTFAVLKGDPAYAGIGSEIRTIVLAKDRLPGVRYMGGMLYNFWQDSKNVRGVWRRTDVDSYKTKDPKWEILLDLDQLAETEKENWVWKGFNCMPPTNERCLLSLSRGGKDAKVIREFDIRKKAFVENGFVLPEAKSQVFWIDENTLYVATDFGEGSLSKAGYPIVSKVWKRGTALEEAKEVHRGSSEDIWAYSYVSFRPEGKYRFHARGKSFFEFSYEYENEKGQKFPISMPHDASFDGIYRGLLLFTLRSDLEVKGKKYLRGSVVGLPISKVKNGESAREDLEKIFEPTGKKFLTHMSVTKSAILLSVMDNVKGKIIRVTYTNGDMWLLEDVPLMGNGVAEVYSVDELDDYYLATYTDFLTPTSIHWGDASMSGGTPPALKRSPARFDSKDLVSFQYEAVSKDGAKIPYFVVHKKSLKKDGKNPTLLYGYGGFEIPMTPYYLNSAGKVWLERGGVYVVANIRGGGEFGPAWHQAAIRENRQKSFDDFIAVGEDLVKRKITAPKHLGIQGGSNGGLLTGAVFVQRPDLFSAVLCEVPLLDMLRYHLLLAGASWMEEYGNPDDPAMRTVLEKYSPYQNLQKDKKYPEVFFLTSTKDDRVHPAHARKMVAKMREQGHPVFYYENTEGGHGGAANLEQRIQWAAMEYTYLWRKLK